LIKDMQPFIATLLEYGCVILHSHLRLTVSGTTVPAHYSVSFVSSGRWIGSLPFFRTFVQVSGQCSQAFIFTIRDSSQSGIGQATKDPLQDFFVGAHSDMCTGMPR